MNRTVAALTCSLILASAAFAGPIAKDQVSADAKWVAHLDVEALLASQIVQTILAEEQKKGLAEKLAKFTETFGLDPLKDLRSVTLWGETFGPAGGVAIIQAKVDQEKLLKLLAANAGHKETKYGERAVHQWTQSPEGKGDTGIRFGTFYKDDVTVITRSEDVLKHAIDVLDAKESSLAKEDSGLLPAESKGAFLVAAAKDITVPEEADPHAAMLRKVSGGTLVVGEDGDNVFVNASVVGKTDKDAQQFRQMAQGMLALAQVLQEQAIQAGKPAPAWAELTKGLKVGGEAAVVTMEFTGPVKDVTEMILKAAEAKKAAMSAGVHHNRKAPVAPPAPQSDAGE